jgi:hypothetical protein
VVFVTKKRELKPFKENQALGNFLQGGWDFSRFVCLLEKLRDDIDPMPSQKEVVRAVQECRSARNKDSHPDYDPRKDGKTDYQLATLVEAARTYLPKINDLQGQEAAMIYESCNKLDNCLYYRENDVIDVSELFC